MSLPWWLEALILCGWQLLKIESMKDLSRAFYVIDTYFLEINSDFFIEGLTLLGVSISGASC
ncbi:hypothetical protein [Microbulbifer sp. JMSA008]|uniref:hypothetical protein n=1 Tax=Microbulbifer sp. JMSA008 TaxID=3243373 RepID=UPI00403A50A2